VRGPSWCAKDRQFFGAAASFDFHILLQAMTFLLASPRKSRNKAAIYLLKFVAARK
jgi:hypothetical protein